MRQQHKACDKPPGRAVSTFPVQCFSADPNAQCLNACTSYHLDLEKDPEKISKRYGGKDNRDHAGHLFLRVRGTFILLTNI